VNTIKYLGHHELVFMKGIYPYSYTTDRSKFQETPLQFLQHSSRRTALRPRLPTRTRYLELFGIRNLQQYHDHYLLSDVMLLS